MARTHAPCSQVSRLGRSAPPARRPWCRASGGVALGALLGERDRIYVAGRELDGDGVIDVVDAHGRLRDRLPVVAPDWGSQAAALLEDATGHPPQPATAAAFAVEVLGRQPYEGFALSSSEVCAWLLLRAIAREER